MPSINADGWLDSASRAIIRTRSGRILGGLSYHAHQNVPWRLLLHTTEGTSIEGAEAAYRANGSAPHFTISPGRVHQHISLRYGAYALRNEAGGVETNRMHCIQIEIVGFAAQSHTWPMAYNEYLGTALIGPILEWGGASINAGIVPRFLNGDDGFLASPSAKQRMSYPEWATFNGICGHQHAPENSHWDPGRINISAILDAAHGAGDEMSEEQYQSMMRSIGLVGMAVSAQGESLMDIEERIQRLEERWKGEVKRDARSMEQERNIRRLVQAMAVQMGIDTSELGLE